MNTTIDNASEVQNVNTIERVASVVAGSLLLFTVFNGSLRFLGLGSKLGISSYLLYRGITGHCKLYESAGVNTVENGEVKAG